MSFYHIIYTFLSVSDMLIMNFCYQMQTLYFHIPKCVFEILSVFLKTQIKLGQVSGSYLNPPLLGMTLNKNVCIEKYWWRNYPWDFTQRGWAKD
jgi:hypothetical protein